eukprot:11380954-Ditylum_brightwellii.AAC.1
MEGWEDDERGAEVEEEGMEAIVGVVADDALVRLFVVVVADAAAVMVQCHQEENAELPLSCVHRTYEV